MGANPKSKNESFAASAHLVESASKGDRNALNVLCDSIAKGVFYRVKYTMDDLRDAEDVAQNVLLRVCEKISDIREPRAFRVWLGRIILNETNMFWIKKSKQKSILNIDDYAEVFIEERDTFLPAEYAENKEVRKTVLTAISKLPERQRQTVLFYYYDGLNVKDISESMGLVKQTVSTHLHRAREAIKKELDNKEYKNIKKSKSSMQMGLFLFGLIREDITNFVIPDASWLPKVLAECHEYITAGAAAATTAATAKAITGGIIATGSAAVKVCASVVIAGAVCIGSYFGLEAMQNNIIQSHIEKPSIEGTIVFAGGVNYRGSDRVNPTRAEPLIEYSQYEIISIEWWITEKDSTIILYQGNDDYVDEALFIMKEQSQWGEYMLYFKIKCKEDVSHRMGKSFYIQDIE